ncbi:MAG: phosphoglycerate dehydrogenase [Lachnospiraceae bacterium]|jgi:D-3-phosphoglycerate dehydrogenase|nr:phosphoglycerate dehydrogenase [Lachnospiraceae bacterium]
MYQYHCLNPIAEVGLKRFDGNYAKTDNIANADAVLVRSAAMHDMEIPENVCVIGRAGAGVNNIPLGKCSEQGIAVFNTPGANANGVKELVLAGMLLASRDIIGGLYWVRSERQNEELAQLAEKQKKAFAGNEIMGKRLGVIGLGAIGILVANAAAALGMEVYGYDPYISVNAAWNLSRDVKHITDVNDIYRECDYITIHVPLMESTKGMIGSSAIAQMKNSVVILNFARGPLVDTKAIVEALRTNRIRKYVTDFPTSDIASMKNAIVIPHLGASTEESEENCAIMAVQEIRDYLENGNIHNSVNYPNCDMGVCKYAMRVTIIHRNIPNMLTKFTATFGDLGINIERMSNETKGEYGYVIMDLANEADEDSVNTIRKIKGVLKVRVMR